MPAVGAHQPTNESQQIPRTNQHLCLYRIFSKNLLPQWNFNACIATSRTGLILRQLLRWQNQQAATCSLSPGRILWYLVVDGPTNNTPHHTHVSVWRSEFWQPPKWITKCQHYCAVKLLSRVGLQLKIDELGYHSTLRFCRTYIKSRRTYYDDSVVSLKLSQICEKYKPIAAYRTCVNRTAFL